MTGPRWQTSIDKSMLSSKHAPQSNLAWGIIWYCVLRRLACAHTYYPIPTDCLTDPSAAVEQAGGYGMQQAGTAGYGQQAQGGFGQGAGGYGQQGGYGRQAGRGGAAGGSTNRYRPY